MQECTAVFEWGLSLRAKPEMLRTDRLMLRLWQEYHREPFALLHADPNVMADQGGPLTRVASDAKLERYWIASEQTGVGRWAVETLGGEFLGYTGVMMRPPEPIRLDHITIWDGA